MNSSANYSDNLSDRDARNDEAVIDALLQFLKSREWQLSVQLFVEANCPYFLTESFLHSHLQIWRNFQNIVENILDTALTNTELHTYGLDSLERCLNRIVQQPVTGPRDARIKELLIQLLSYHDFAAFADMMKTQASLQETSAEGALTQLPRRDRLINFGFNPTIVDIVLEGTSPETPIDELVAMLMTLETSKSVTGNEGCVDTINVQASEEKRYLEVFAECINGDKRKGVQVSAEELEKKFQIAQTVVDILDDDAANRDVLTIVPWSTDMLRFQSKLIKEYNSKHRSCYSQTLLDEYFKLERNRQRIDEETESGVQFLSDDELERLTRLNNIASQGTNHEKYLHQLLTRFEEIQREIQAFQQRIAIFISRDRCVSRSNMEELYIYLKEKIASGEDFQMISNELHDRVHSLVSDRATNVVNTLLELQLLEDEQNILRSKIRDVVSEDRSDEDRYRNLVSEPAVDSISNSLGLESLEGLSMRFDLMIDNDGDPSRNDLATRHYDAIQGLQLFLQNEKDIRAQKLKNRRNQRKKSIDEDDLKPTDDLIIDQIVTEMIEYSNENQISRKNIDQFDTENIVVKHHQRQKELLERLVETHVKSRDKLFTRLMEKRAKRLMQKSNKDANIAIDSSIAEETELDSITSTLVINDRYCLAKLSAMWLVSYAPPSSDVDSADDWKHKVLDCETAVHNNIEACSAIRERILDIEAILSSQPLDDNTDTSAARDHFHQRILDLISFVSTASVEVFNSNAIENNSMNDRLTVKEALIQRFKQSQVYFDDTLRLMKKRAETILEKRRRLKNQSDNQEIDELLEIVSVDPMKAIIFPEFDIGLSDVNGHNKHLIVDVALPEKSSTEDSKLDTAKKEPLNSLLQSRSNNSRHDNQILSSQVKSSHEARERELVDGLHVQMLMKKQNLADRLERKRKLRRDRKDASSDFDDDINAAVEIDRLEKAFEKIISLVEKNASNDMQSLMKLSIPDLLRMVDRLMNGEVIDDISTKSPKTIIADVTLETHESESLPLGKVKESVFQSEARRITISAAEEREKYDLSLRLQQARERQSLQRKLLERKSSKQSYNSTADPKDSSFAARIPSPTNKQQQDVMLDMKRRGMNLTPMMTRK